MTDPAPADMRAAPPDARAFFDASPFATLHFTPDLVLVDCNGTHARMTGVDAEALRGRPMFEVFPSNPEAGGPDTEAVIRASVARAIASRASDEPPTQRHDLPRGDGTFGVRYWRMIHSPVVHDGAVTGVRQDSWDVTEAVQLVERQRAMQRIAGSIAGIAFWEHDPATSTMIRTPELDRMFGFPPPNVDEFGGGSIGRPTDMTRFHERVHPDDMETLARGTAELFTRGEGAAQQTEYRVILPGNEVRTLAVRGEVSRGAQGQPIIVGTTIDVTDLHAKEARLQTMLDEVNHRVKNALQLIGAILAIEARSAPAGERARLNASAARVQAVAAVHAALYEDDDIRSVAFADHLRGFCNRLAGSMGADERGIALRVEAEHVTLLADTAIPLSLIVNELVANAFKYAFPPGADVPADAEVAVTFGRRSDGGLTLIVADNGGGGGTRPPAEASSLHGSATGLGTKLIAALARQIGASVSTRHDGGWSTRIEFDAQAPVL